MIDGGIFSIPGISVERVGNATPIAILVGSILAFFAAIPMFSSPYYTKMQVLPILSSKRHSPVTIFSFRYRMGSLWEGNGIAL